MQDEPTERLPRRCHQRAAGALYRLRRAWADGPCRRDDQSCGEDQRSDQKAKINYELCPASVVRHWFG